jgi:hypothetical protein
LYAAAMNRPKLSAPAKFGATSASQLATTAMTTVEQQARTGRAGR